MATSNVPSRPRSLTRRKAKPLATYLFAVQLEHEDGKWSAWIEELPGCATWGYTAEEALRHIREAAELYVAAMSGRLPKGTRPSRTVSVAVTV